MAARIAAAVIICLAAVLARHVQWLSLTGRVSAGQAGHTTGKSG
jgi:hypothetical protein